MACTPEFIAQILGDMPQYRTQNAGLQLTSGKDPRYFVRPYVDRVDKATGTIKREQVRIDIGPKSMGKRAAEHKRQEVMAQINQAKYIVASQIDFASLVTRYRREAMRKLSSSTWKKYDAHLRNHIEPMFAGYSLYQITPDVIQSWLDSKESAYSWATRTDMRNILSALFTEAIRWGWWRDGNPVEHCTTGPAQPKREFRKFTVAELQRFLDLLRPDVRLLCKTVLFTGMRISEVLGLQWRDFDPQAGALSIRRRYYRGDISQPKTTRSARVVPLGILTEEFAAMERGLPEQFIFALKTKYGTTRDDRIIWRYFCKPAAQQAGIYSDGVAFHSLRREAVTEYDRLLQGHQLKRLVGHSRESMTGHYVQRDFERQEAAVIEFQSRILEKRAG